MWLTRLALRNPILEALDDQAVLPVERGRVAFTTDSYVVTPIFFPGGDIGELAVNGTVNDLAVGGARPLWLSLAFILEEGLLLSELERVVADRPNFVDALAALGLARYLSGDAAGAQAVWKDCLSERPSNARVEAYLGMLERAET